MKITKVTLILFILVSISGCGKKGARDIRIFEKHNQVGLIRDGMDIELYEDMPMDSGDRLKTEKNSYAKLSIDHHKIVHMDEQSEITIATTGNKKTNHTKIQLEKGTIYNQVNEKLTNKSSYKVYTGNTTISVHGTVFSVGVIHDEKGNPYTKVNVLEGEVAVQIGEEEKKIQSGSKATIYTDEIGNVKVEETPLTIEELTAFELESITQTTNDSILSIDKESAYNQLEILKNQEVDQDHKEEGNNQSKGEAEKDKGQEVDQDHKEEGNNQSKGEAEKDKSQEVDQDHKEEGNNQSKGEAEKDKSQEVDQAYKEEDNNQSKDKDTDDDDDDDDEDDDDDDDEDNDKED